MPLRYCTNKCLNFVKNTQYVYLFGLSKASRINVNRTTLIWLFVIILATDAKLRAGDVRGLYNFGSNIQPLNAQLKEATDYQIKTQILLELSRFNQQISIHKALAYAREAGRLAELTGNMKALASALLMQAQVFSIGFVVDSAGHYLDEAYKVASKHKLLTELGYILSWKAIESLYHNDQGLFFQDIRQSEMYFKNAKNKEGLLFMLYTQSRIYISLGLAEQAEKIVEKGLSMINADDDPLLRIFLNQRLSEVYGAMGNYDKGMALLEDDLIFIRLTGNKFHEASNLRLIGILLINKGEFGKALDYLYKAYEICYPAGLKRSAADILTLLSNVYRKTKNYDLSILMNHQALQMRRELGFSTICMSSMINLGYVFSVAQRIDSAEVWLRKGYKMALAFGHDPSIARVTGILSEIYAKQGKNKDALYFFKAYKDAETRHNTNTRRNSFLALNESMEANRLEALANEYSRENQNRLFQIYIGIGLGLLLLLSGLLAVQVHQVKERQKTSRLREILLRLQMNPHFIFNALIAIQSFIYRNNPMEASRFLNGFSSLIRLFLTSSQSDFIPVSEDISIIQHYLDIQKLRYEEKFDYKVTIGPGLNPRAVAIPPMLTQPFLENAIEHGFSGIKERGLLEIFYSQEKSGLKITVCDNGIGFRNPKPAGRFLPDHQPMAMSITRERLKILNSRYGRKNIQLTVTDNPMPGWPFPGTKVIFFIPNVKPEKT